MANQDDDLLLSLQSSLRNALNTFGPSSPQYLGIKYMVDEQAAKIALRNKSLNQDGAADGRVMNLVFRPKKA